MPSIKNTYHAKSSKEWRAWLKKNHKKEDHVWLVKFKRHTGKPAPSHQESMDEAICFGWIDTIVKRIDDEKYARCFVRRKETANWSNATLSYAKRLIKEKRMSKAGLIAYKLGIKKPTIDHNLPRNPKIPEDLKKALEKNKTALENFNNFAPSYKRYHIYYILKAKRTETRAKRIKEVFQKAKNNQKQ